LPKGVSVHAGFVLGSGIAGAVGDEIRNRESIRVDFQFSSIFEDLHIMLDGEAVRT
jgi:hypothetical protein